MWCVAHERQRLVDVARAGVRAEAAHVQRAGRAAQRGGLVDAPAGQPGDDHSGAERVAAAGGVDDGGVVGGQRALAVVVDDQAAIGAALDDHAAAHRARAGAARR